MRPDMAETASDRDKPINTTTRPFGRANHES